MDQELVRKFQAKLLDHGGLYDLVPKDEFDCCLEKLAEVAQAHYEPWVRETLESLAEDLAKALESVLAAPPEDPEPYYKLLRRYDRYDATRFVTTEHPPAMPVPEGCRWDGEWELSSYWDGSMPLDSEGEPCWTRRYLALDGHEYCCKHTRYVHVRVTSDGS